MRRKPKTYHRKDPGKCQAERAQLRPLPAADGDPSTGRGGMEQRQPIRVEKGGMGSARQASRDKKKIEQNQPAHNRPILGSQGALIEKTCRGEEKDMQERGKAEHC